VNVAGSPAAAAEPRLAGSGSEGRGGTMARDGSAATVRASVAPPGSGFAAGMVPSKPAAGSGRSGASRIAAGPDAA
jgi:hypothetical protein